MDEETRRVIIRVRLEKCKEDLQAAQELLRLGFLRAAVNRAYYGVFHITSAALLTLDIERSKHSGVQSAFSQHLVKSGHIEPEYSKIYGRARRLREDYDYADELRDLDEKVTADLLADAEKFVARMERYLRKAGEIG
jgi:uncharacterized protein (UPF0332 family)